MPTGKRREVSLSAWLREEGGRIGCVEKKERGGGGGCRRRRRRRRRWKAMVAMWWDLN